MLLSSGFIVCPAGLGAGLKTGGGDELLAAFFFPRLHSLLTAGRVHSLIEVFGVFKQKAASLNGPHGSCGRDPGYSLPFWVQLHFLQSFRPEADLPPHFPPDLPPSSEGL